MDRQTALSVHSSLFTLHHNIDIIVFCFFGLGISFKDIYNRLHFCFNNHNNHRYYMILLLKFSVCLSVCLSLCLSLCLSFYCPSLHFLLSFSTTCSLYLSLSFSLTHSLVVIISLIKGHSSCPVLPSCLATELNICYVGRHVGIDDVPCQRCLSKSDSGVRSHQKCVECESL